MLHTSLSAHPDIHVQTGTFNPSGTSLNEVIFENHSPEKSAVGFVLHRSGDPSGHGPSFWKQLEADPELHIVSLYRHNSLERYMSYLTQSKKIPSLPKDFSAEELRAEFERYEKELANSYQRFSKHPVMRVSYEELSLEYQAVLTRVQVFLGVRVESLTPATQQDEPYPPEKAIANFEELAEYFATTRWAWFFENRSGLLPSVEMTEGATREGKSKEDHLLQYGKKLYSQGNEELIIRSFFRDRRNGVFLDVGCAWPKRHSTTFYLEKHLNWSGIAVDAFPPEVEAWKQLRPKSQLCAFLVTDHSGTEESFYTAGGLGSTQRVRVMWNTPIEGIEVRVPTTTLTKLLDDKGIRKINFLSMDIEGSELQALAGFDIDWFRPDLVCMEHRSKEKEKVMAYFGRHGYEWLSEYLSYDRVNWYFAPRKSPSTAMLAKATFELPETTSSAPNEDSRMGLDIQDHGKNNVVKGGPFKFMGPLTLVIEGNHNEIVIETGLKVQEDGGEFLIKGDHNHILVGSRVSFAGRTVLKIEGNQNQVSLGTRVWGAIRLHVETSGATFQLGAGTTVVAGLFTMQEPYRMVVGEDCMFSGGVWLSVSDMHPIFDLDTNVRLNPGGDVVIDDHVWLGFHSRVLKGVHIGQGSAIGTGAVVVDDIPAHCLAVGVPAKVVRERIYWTRKIEGPRHSS